MSRGSGLFLIFGKTGWIGGMLRDYLEEKKLPWVFATSRLESRDDLAAELDRLQPTFVLNAAGVTGRPNVDWCEDHKADTVRANVVGLLTLCDLCVERDIHLTNFATGCIYSYDSAHPIGGRTFSEEDPANFTGSFYSQTKAMVESLMLSAYAGKKILILRVRMPISDDLSARNFITKISTYKKVVNIPNSMTVLTELLPIAVEAAQRGLVGVFNFTNPGAISHNQILDRFKAIIHPGFTFENFSEEEQAKILKAGRSNNELNTAKLEAAFPTLAHFNIHKSIDGVFQRMKNTLEQQAQQAGLTYSQFLASLGYR